MEEMNNRMGGMEANVESFHGYLRALRDIIIGKENGDKALEWIFRCERYCDVNCLNEQEHLTMVGVCMEGIAHGWLKWREKRREFTSWEKFRNVVLKQFRARHERTPREKLLALRQTDSVQDYRCKFELLSSVMDDMFEETLTDLFMNGLTEEVPAEIKLFHPRDLEETMQHALELQILIASEEEAEEGNERDEETETVEEREIKATLNISSVVGINTPKPMKVLGTVNDREVMVLLDSGATHNFISERLVGELSIPMRPLKFTMVLEDNRRSVCKRGEAYWIELGMTEEEGAIKANYSGPKVSELLEEFKSLFFEPHGLPPRRSKDHAIRLVSGAQPPNVRSYRYPYYQKDEIEKIVHEMLATGIIRPSVSPFSSPDLRELRGFLGLTRYYQRFVKGYGRIASPLMNLLKKNAFRWDATAQEAFKKLKNVMISIPVLAMPNFSKEFVVKTDASGSGLGVMLMQEERPITFLSKALSLRNQGKSIYERELMTIVLALQRWRHYLLGRHFKPGCENKAATALSRKPQFGEEIKAISVALVAETEDIQQEDLYEGEINIFWEGMKKDIKKFVVECGVCQKVKYEAASPTGLLQPLPIPTNIWEDISMDFITGLSKIKGVDTILVVIDHLTNYGHFLTFQHPFTAKEVAEIFVREIVRLHGFPKTIVTDRDRVFMSHLWSEMFKATGTTLKFSSAYHPQTDK
ncbi:uncharacterized protein LOC123204809 [Mangifera indica]|uniref:uncharacterized protein LOC123204809 n=1 Tax=Mangifera indica TaxID=29780 RepID=UPI001CF9C13B|nr:uncharacterized protein LOC123204809 [Mangifera indica]